MFAQLTKNQRNYFAPAAVVLTCTGIFIAHTAYAKLAANTIDPVAIVTDNGRRIIVTGPVICTENETTHLRVTVTQRSTGAMAEGTAFFTCEGNLQHWEVHASVRGKERFQVGPATAVAVARTIEQGDTTDAHQWLVNITLAKK